MRNWFVRRKESEGLKKALKGNAIDRKGKQRIGVWIVSLQKAWKQCQFIRAT